MRPDRFFNYIYAWCVERVKDRADWEQQLLLPLPGQKTVVRKPTEQELASEGADFMKFMGQMTG